MLDPDHPLATLLKRDRRFHFDAYVFVFESLRFAQGTLGLGTAQPSEGEEPEDETMSDEDKHLTGQELCLAIRDYAINQYGYMAKSVLNHWGVHSTGDFGEIVYNLIQVGQMRKTEHDRREDFDDVYDFDAAFRESFEISQPGSGKRKA